MVRNLASFVVPLMVLGVFAGCFGGGSGTSTDLKSSDRGTPGASADPGATVDPGATSEPGSTPSGKNETETRIKVDPNATFSGAAHKHDWWGADTEYAIFDADLKTGPGGACVGDITFACNGGTQFITFKSSDNPAERPNNVWAGTGKIEIKIHTAQIVNPYAIQIGGPGGKFSWTKTESQFKVDKSDQTIVLEPLNESMTDPPHFRSSGWSFRLVTLSPPSAFAGPWHMTVKIFRDPGRELPLDPPHPDYWGAMREHEFGVVRSWANATRVGVVSQGTGYGYGPNYQTGPKTGVKELVTIGTGKMRVVTKWTNSETAGAPKIAMDYCGADQACGSTSAVWFHVQPKEETGSQRTYEFEVRPDQWDSPYFERTHWAFKWYFEDAAGQQNGNFKGYVDWTITIIKQA